MLTKFIIKSYIMLSVHVSEQPMNHALIFLTNSSTPFWINLFILTLPRSVKLVIIAMTTVFCSQTIRQKSANVVGRGPCVAM